MGGRSGGEKKNEVRRAALVEASVFPPRIVCRKAGETRGLQQQSGAKRSHDPTMSSVTAERPATVCLCQKAHVRLHGHTTATIPGQGRLVGNSI